jgi:hypothetical protein
MYGHTKVEEGQSHALRFRLFHIYYMYLDTILRRGHPPDGNFIHLF